MSSVVGRVATEGEATGDRGALLGVLAIGVLVLNFGKSHPTPEKRLLRQLLDLHMQVKLCLCRKERRTYCIQ